MNKPMKEVLKKYGEVDCEFCKKEIDNYIDIIAVGYGVYEDHFCDEECLLLWTWRSLTPDSEMIPFYEANKVPKSILSASTFTSFKRVQEKRKQLVKKMGITYKDIE